MERRRTKLLRYLEWAQATFRHTCAKLIKTGVFERTLRGFDFSSHYDRDEASPRARSLMRRHVRTHRPELFCDEFGDLRFNMPGCGGEAEGGSDIDSGASSSDYGGVSARGECVSDRSDASSSSNVNDTETRFTSHGASRPPAHDYEIFVAGFFYFFVLQDPFVRYFLQLSNIFDSFSDPNILLFRRNLLEDSKVFTDHYLLQWVQCMISIGGFDSPTAELGNDYSPALAY